MDNGLLMFFLKKLLEKMPFPVIQFFLNYSFEKMFNKYPRIFSKVCEKENLSFLIIPIDLPFNFYLDINKDYPNIFIIDKAEIPNTNATIKASLANLLRMFEGKLDGDAAFFSKNLIIEGSTAAVVTLRNAVDGESINIINDLTEEFGILKSFFRKLVFTGLKNYNDINKLINEMQEELLKQCNNTLKQQSKDINYLKKEFDKLRSNILKNQER